MKFATDIIEVVTRSI